MESATEKVAGADGRGCNSTKKEEASNQTNDENAVDVETKIDRDPSNPPNSIHSTVMMMTTPPTTRPSSKKKPPLSNATMTPPKRPTTMTPPLPQLLQLQPPPQPSSRGPSHSSAPSMVFPKPLPSISAHNRNITPHTESLMNLFARPPASTPMTPITPIEYNIGAANNNNGSTGQQQQQPHPTMEQVRTPRRTNSVEKIRRMRDEDFPTSSTDAEMDNNTNSPEIMPLIPKLAGTQPANFEREITITTNNLHTNAKVFHRQNTHATHNRDETQLAHNLKAKDREEEERQYINDVLDSANEKTGLLTTRQHAPGNNQNPTAITTSISTSISKCGLDKFRSLLVHNCDSEHLKPTFIGAFLFSLYQLVFCFAEASAISRPSHAGTASSSALLSPMALMACMGSLLSAPMLIAVLSDDYPALYPCLDMFMAPFLAQMAADVDEVLATMRGEGGGEDYDDDTATFLATFVALNAFGMLFSGLLCVLAGKVKLANLAGFLPYPVLCGFFSSVGISIWMSAFKVDTGVTIQRAVSSGSWSFLLRNFARHAPSFVAGAALYVLGPRGPHFLLGIIAATIVSAYLTMFMTGTSLEEAQDMSFFWKKEEVMMSEEAREFSYGPPAAFGLWSPNVLKMICWPAFMNGVSGVIAMSVIYLLRCSLHAAALNKCTAQNKSNEGGAESHPLSSANGDQNIQSKHQNGNASALEMEQGHELKPKQKPKDLMMWYANSLFSVAFAGGFAVLPAIALGGIFSKIGASSRAPQYGAIILLLGCYLSDFWICSYVPKCTFSSLLVLAAIDLINSWFIKSYQKSATEWVVVPFIVITSLTSGMLQSVGMGLGASTLIFVASFYRAGVVKFIANGLTIRSTIERNCEDNQWLHENADLIQLLVLQNYLFFGNASSCLKYIQSMFDDEGGSDPDLPPFPKYVILDLSIVTGIDTSAVDVLGEISALCKENKCNLIFAGIPRVIRPALITGGVKPSRKNQHLNFSPDLDSALGRAEDGLLKFVGHNEEKAADVGAKLKHKRRVSMVDHGLRHALREIDVQHNISLAKHLQILEKSTTPIEINAGEKLIDAARDENLLRGLYFVESGIIRCDHDSSMSLTRGGTRSGFFAAPHIDSSTDSLGQVHARSATVGRTANLLKKNPQGAALMAQDHVFRLARIGPGWVIGSISEFLGQDIPGTYTALTPCRVHHLSFETLEELEVDSPVLILHLYKLLSHLSARRQEMTIGQLATMRSIFSSTAPTKPISRSKMVKLCAYSAH